MEIMDKLKQAKKKVETARTKQAELDGRRKQLMEQLQNDFKLSSVADAEERLEYLENQVSDLTVQIGERVSDLDLMMEEMDDDK